MVVVKVYEPIETKSFINIKFKEFRGANRTEDVFMLAELPCMNPFDWVSLFLILSKDEQKFEPIIGKLK